MFGWLVIWLGNIINNNDMMFNYLIIISFFGVRIDLVNVFFVEVINRDCRLSWKSFI